MNTIDAITATAFLDGITFKDADREDKNGVYQRNMQMSRIMMEMHNGPNAASIVATLYGLDAYGVDEATLKYMTFSPEVIEAWKLTVGDDWVQVANQVKDNVTATRTMLAVLGRQEAQLMAYPNMDDPRRAERRAALAALGVDAQESFDNPEITALRELVQETLAKRQEQIN